jgi:replicative DNA helicase
MQRVCELMEQQGVTPSQMAAMRGRHNFVAKYAPTRASVSEYAEILCDKTLQQACESDLFWDRVIAISEEAEEEVFDLTVPGPASWFADGIATHNSGAIEQDADMILLIYREEVYDKNTNKKGIAEIDLAKHRNGEIGTFALTFQGQYSRFQNYAPDSYAEGVLR